jgi:type IV pilus assembly protein PilA
MHRRDPAAKSGFSIVEMVFVLGVLGILLAMAIPAMQAMALRRQVAESLPLAKLAEAGVQARWSASNKMPANNAEAGLPLAEKIISNTVSRVDVSDGAVNLTFGNNAGKALHGRRLSLRPAVVVDTPMVPIAWLCNNVAVPSGMQVRGENVTDVPPEWLPVECRGLATSGK